ncbi:MAG: hypothetical protein ACLTYN_07505 [Dysosmobacter welbionis]
MLLDGTCLQLRQCGGRPPEASPTWYGAADTSAPPQVQSADEAFGWDIPTYVHCSQLCRTSTTRCPSARGPLTGRAQGYLTEAILNYVALWLGPQGRAQAETLPQSWWSPSISLESPVPRHLTSTSSRTSTPRIFAPWRRRTSPKRRALYP